MMDSMNTSPHIRDLLIIGIENWFKGNEDIQEHENLNEVLLAQNRIGWRQIFSGRMAVAWEHAQDKHRRRTWSNNKKNTGLILTT